MGHCSSQRYRDTATTAMPCSKPAGELRRKCLPLLSPAPKLVMHASDKERAWTAARGLVAITLCMRNSKVGGRVLWVGRNRCYGKQGTINTRFYADKPAGQRHLHWFRRLLLGAALKPHRYFAVVLTFQLLASGEWHEGTMRLPARLVRNDAQVIAHPVLRRD
jgi:hypothetical protein